MPDDKDERPYSIGYRNPPQHSQFKKGKSGNYNGRPKGSKNIATALHDELNKKISVTENGTRRAITKREAVVKQVVNNAAAGDPKAARTLLQISRELGDLKLPDIRQPIKIIRMIFDTPNKVGQIEEDRSYRNEPPTKLIEQEDTD